MFLCVCVVVAQMGIYVPIFTEIFSPIFTSGVSTLSFNLEKINISYNTVNAVMTVNGNFDFDINNYYVFVVEADNASDEKVATLWSQIGTHATKIDSKTTKVGFEHYITTSGLKTLKPDSNYSIVLASKCKLISKHDFMTEKFEYLTIETKNQYDDEHGKYKYLLVRAIMNPKFMDYSQVYYEIINTTTKEKAYSIEYKENLSPKSFALYTFKKDDPITSFELNIYILPTNPLEFFDYDYVEKDGNRYYLIYIHDELLKI